MSSGWWVDLAAVLWWCFVGVTGLLALGLILLNVRALRDREPNSKAPPGGPM